MTRDPKRIKVMAFMEADTVAGPAKTLIELTKLARLGGDELPEVDILITTFHRHGASEGFINAVKAAGLNISVIPEKGPLDLRILPKLQAAIADFAPDIIQSSNIKSHFLVKMLRLYRRYPWIAWHHGYTTTDFKMLVYNQLNRYSVRSAHRVVVVCRAFIEQMTRIGVQPERIDVQHNTITPFIRPADSELQSLRASLGLHNGARVLLSVGRLSREKGHQDLIKAVALFRKESPQMDFKLVLLGDGPERAAIDRFSRELQVRDLIVFAGHQKDVSPYYAIADVCVLPSHSEGSPNALLEAMAAGVPNLATSVGGVPEIAAHEENAWLVPKSDGKAMAGGLRRLLSDPGLRARIIENGRKVTEKYTPTQYRQNVVQIYKKLMETQRPWS